MSGINEIERQFYVTNIQKHTEWKKFDMKLKTGESYEMCRSRDYVTPTVDFNFLERNYDHSDYMEAGYLG